MDGEMNRHVAERKPRTFGLWMTVAGLLLPVAYLLSIGVLIRLEARGRLPESFLEPAIMYAAPYNWVCDNLPPQLKPAIDGYENLWRP